MDDRVGYISKHDWDRLVDFHRQVNFKVQHRVVYGVLCDDVVYTDDSILEEVIIYTKRDKRHRTIGSVHFMMYKQPVGSCTIRIKLPSYCEAQGDIHEVDNGYLVLMTDIAILKTRLHTKIG